MYMDRMLEVGKAENGYVVSCNVPIKSDKKQTAKDTMSCYPSSCDKTFLAKDETEVADIIKKLMPLLDTDFTTEDAFDKAFETAAGLPDDSMED